MERIWLGPFDIRFLLEGTAAAGSVAMFEFDVPASARVPIAHSHDAYEETIYGLKGVLTWTVEGQPHRRGPGEVLCIPRGVVHRFDNTSGADATMLAVVTPGLLSPDYFRELAALVSALPPVDRPTWPHRRGDAATRPDAGAVAARLEGTPDSFPPS